MTQPKKFKKGHRSYEKWGGHVTLVHIEGKKKTTAPSVQTVSVIINSKDELGVYANQTVIHHSGDEVIMDFCFIPPGSKQVQLRSRVVLSAKQAEKIQAVLTEIKPALQGKKEN